MDTQKLIVDKITAVLESTDKNQSAELKKLIDQAGHIFVAGAGRSKHHSGWVETVDMNFEDKKPSAIGMEDLDSDGAGKREEHIRHMLSYRYLLVKESKDKINEDLIWMLQSQSVILMQAERTTSSWLMESFLIKDMQYVAVSSDYSDVSEKIKWCEENTEEAKMISERASLFVHDMILDRVSERENEEVKFQVMERYSELFG